MIFVSVGTHEQQFDRLISEVDRLVESGEINEEVFIQSGYSNYVPKHCKYSKLISYEDMQNYAQNSRIMITHGGPASIMLALQYRKIPIIVPRKYQLGEHVNNHQVDFVEMLYKNSKCIIPIYDICKLEEAIENYSSYNNEDNYNIKSNNSAFNKELSKLINGL